MLKIECIVGARHRIFHFCKTRFGRIVIVTMLGVSTAIACGWSFVTDHSVRFNEYRTGRAFYRLPPLPIAVDPVTGKEQSVAEAENYEDYDESRFDAEQAAMKRPSEVWDRAMAASEKSDHSKLEKSLRAYLELTKYTYIDGTDRDRRNIATDLLDALAEIRHGSEKQAVMAYVTSRLELYNHVPDADARIPESTNDRNLKDNWAYLRSAVLYHADKKEEALAAFERYVGQFPKSEKNEAVMYMIGRIKLEGSHSFDTENCGIEGKTGGWDNEEVKPEDIEDPQKCRDENWQTAMDQFKLMLRKFPNGRYSLDAQGWIAFLYKRGGYRAEALAEYYRLLGQTKDLAWRLEAKKSLQIIGHEYDDETLDKLEAIIADEPQTALAYAYHRIYNQAVDLTYEEFAPWCCYGEDRWSEQEKEAKRVKDAQDSGHHELERIAKFATAMVKRYGTSRVSGDFMLRIAEAQLELQKVADAGALAQKALSLSVKGDVRAQALWVKGSAEHELKKFMAARATFAQLIDEFPDNKLNEGARRLLAMTAEDQDDLETALEQYLALKYDYDVAYFIDVLMPTDRFAKFVARHKESDQYNFLLYSLGVRYMRDRRWNEARAALKGVVTRTDTDQYSYDETPTFPKSPETNFQQEQKDRNLIQTIWVMRDLQTINDLERLESVAAAAADDESKAEAMYQLASYQFDADELLFYNPAAWEGIRHFLLFDLTYSDHLRLPGEGQNLFVYSKSHETMARAIPIYLDIVDRYPNTKAANDALFSAVVAHEKLSDMNGYWRSVYANGLFAGQRVVTNSDIRRMFPKFKWPISRLEWEASTRTVDGGSAYPKPPKPLPRLSRAERAKRKLKGWYAEYSPPVGNALSAVKTNFSRTSKAVADQLVRYLYLVYAGFIGLIIWTNRRQLYDGPITKGFEFSQIACRHFADRWAGPIWYRLNHQAPLIDIGKLTDEAEKDKAESVSTDINASNS